MSVRVSQLITVSGPGARRALSSVRFLAQGLSGALVGGVAARAAYALLTRPRRTAVYDGPKGAGAVGGTAVAAVPVPRAERVLAGGVTAVSATKGTGPAGGVIGVTWPKGADGAGPFPGPGMRFGGAVATVDPDAPGAWRRSNFRGRTVTLHQGPALAFGVCVASLCAPGLSPRVRAASALAAAGAAGFGVYDDLACSVQARGLRGHLGALTRGQVTTGMVKMAGIGATGIAAASLLRRSPMDTLLDGVLIAASANLLNLFDLRPGRAAKVALFAAAPALASSAAPLLGPVLGASAALLPDELAERSMLGDAGANALGAVLGTAAAAGAPRGLRAALLGGVVALTLASELTSFSRVIDRVPALRRLDRWGRHE